MEQSKEQILQMLNEGSINAEEADRLLAAIDETIIDDRDILPVAEPVDVSDMPDIHQLRETWQKGFWVSMAIMGISGTRLLSTRDNKRGFFSGIGRIGSWVVFSLGLVGSLLAYWSKGARWFFVHIEDNDKVIELNLPLPIHGLSWLLRRVEMMVEGEEAEQARMAAEFIDAILAEMDSPTGDPIMMDISDEGQRVQLYVI